MALINNKYIFHCYVVSIARIPGVVVVVSYNHSFSLFEETAAIMSADWAEAVRVAGEGFGVVFIVLVLLWLVSFGLGKIFQRWEKEEEPEPEKPDNKQA